MRLDHLAVAAENLGEGRALVEEALGLALQPGGQHAHFGTHNLLMGLADGLYLEVIAVDPEAPAPGYPRWFDLDRFHGAPRLADLGARLTRLVVAHPEAPALRAELSELSDPRVVFEPGAPGLRAEIATPHGMRVLE
jgi:hypothetical protein